jgi:hypothetical protein
LNPLRFRHDGLYWRNTQPYLNTDLSLCRMPSYIHMRRFIFMCDVSFQVQTWQVTLNVKFIYETYHMSESHMHESCMWHVTYDWNMSRVPHVNESCTSHVTYGCVMHVKC